MINFSTYVVEDDAVQQIIGPLQALASTVTFSATRTQRIEAAIQALFRALQADQVYNVDFTEIKDTLSNTLIYNAISEHMKTELYAVGHAISSDQQRREFYDKYGDINNTIAGGPKNLAKLSDAPDKFPGLIAAAKAQIALKAALDRLKPKIVKGRKPSDAAIQKAAAAAAIPTATVAKHREVGATIREMLHNSTVDIRKTLLDNTMDRHISALKSLKSIQPMTIEMLRGSVGKYDMMMQAVASMVVINRGKTFDIRDDAEQVVRKAAERQVENVLTAFIEKNTDKLLAIAAKKDGIAEHKILMNRVVNNVFENSMSFKFTDGSSFKIYSQVVYKSSVNNKPFIQVPTRFTDVIHADGTRMSSPSYEKLVKEL